MPTGWSFLCFTPLIGRRKAARLSSCQRHKNPQYIADVTRTPGTQLEAVFLPFSFGMDSAPGPSTVTTITFQSVRTREPGSGSSNGATTCDRRQMGIAPRLTT